MALEAKNKRMIADHNAGKLSNAEFRKWQKTYAYLSDRYELEMQLMFKPSDEVYRYWVSTGRNTLATKHYIVRRDPSLGPLLFPPPPPPDEPVVGQEVITLELGGRKKGPPGGRPPPGGGGPGGPPPR